MDIATIVGILGGAGLIIWAILSKSPIEAFIDPGSVAIVIGGAAAASTIAFPLRHMLGIFKVTKKAFFAKPKSAVDLIKELVGYAEIARRDGILSLEAMAKSIEDPFIVTGIQMAVDGTDPELIEQIMTADLDASGDRHEGGKAIWDSIGRYAPAFGMIGTLVGLVIMLQNMDDPSSIGPAMAVALLTTLYGAVVANLIALPIADKLGRRSEEELLLKTIVIKGVMSIQSGDNPRIVEQKLKTFLPPSVRDDDSGSGG